jgi:hypothetical protein
MTDHWAEANGGLRGSTFLRLGAVAYLLAAALHVAARLLAPEGATPSDPMFMIALVVWDLTLFLLATGFFWTGIHPFLTRTGLGLGLFLYLQGGYLLLSLVTGHPYGLPPSMLTVGRTFLLAVFAIIEWRNIGRGPALLLGITAGLQFVRVFLRGLDIFPPLPQPGEAVLSAVFMSATAVAILLAARAIRGHEGEWALAHAPNRNARFAAFNNPQHDWNRNGKSRV